MKIIYYLNQQNYEKNNFYIHNSAFIVAQNVKVKNGKKLTLKFG